MAERLDRHDLVRPDGRRALLYGTLGGHYDGRLDDPDQPAGMHLRYDVLTGAWVAISPQRNVRPLDHATEPDAPVTCPFCPGGVEIPFSYQAAVIENRFPSFVGSPPQAPALEWPTGRAVGRCEVVLYTSRHDASFADLEPRELTRVLAVWIDRSRELWADPAHEYVLVFENRGAEAGATIAHPHGQIYALGHVPPLARSRLDAHERYRADHGTCLGCDVLGADEVSERVVYENDSVVLSVPFAARWPYELAVRARRHGLRRLGDLRPEEQLDLVRALRDATLRLDALFGFQLPYMMVAQEAPHGAADWHLSFEIYPLHRGRGKTKIRASVETAAGLFLNDVLPEHAAAALRALRVAAAAIDLQCLYDVVPAAPKVGAVAT